MEELVQASLLEQVVTVAVGSGCPIVHSASDSFSISVVDNDEDYDDDDNNMTRNFYVLCSGPLYTAVVLVDCKTQYVIIEVNGTCV